MTKHYIGKVYDFDPREFQKCKDTFNGVLRQLDEANAENSLLKLLISEVVPYVEDWIALADVMGVSRRKEHWETWLSKYTSLKTPHHSTTTEGSEDV